MSDIFVPTLGVSSPKYVDGLENLVARSAGLSSNAAAFTTIGEIAILPNTFSNDRNNSRLSVDFIGQTVGVLGNKTYRTQIDGVVLYTTAASTPAISPGSLWITVIVLYRNNQFLAYMRSRTGDTALGALNLNSLGSSSGGFTAFDPSISHTVTLQVSVANAGDLARCDLISASFR